MRERRGPKTEPWGTPASIPPHSDSKPSITAHCFLFDNQLSSNDSNLPRFHFAIT